LKLLIKYYFILFLHFGYSNTIFPTEEEIYEAQEKWDLKFQTGKFNMYSNYLISENQNKFYTRFYRQTNTILYGFRIGDEINEYIPNIDRIFLKFKFQSTYLQIGSFKILSGKGLSFGSEYGTSYQVESVNSLAKNNWQFKPNLSSNSLKNNFGLLSGFNTKFIDLNFLNDFSTKSNFLFIKSKFKNIELGLINSLSTNQSSGVIQYSTEKIKLNAEFLNKSSVISFYNKNSLVSYFIHLRYYQPNFIPFYGKHFKRLNKDYGEKGIIASISRIYKKSIYSIGFEYYKPIIASYNYNNTNSRYYFHCLTKIKQYQIGLDLEQRKYFESNYYYENNLVFEKFQLSTYNKFGIVCIINKNIPIKLQTIQLKNKLENNYAYSLSVRHNGINLPKGKIKFGFIKYSVPNWNVRTFDYEPGLPGEFLLNAHNGNGFTIFSVFSLPISTHSNFHFKTSISKQNAQELNFKLGMQLNIGF